MNPTGVKPIVQGVGGLVLAAGLGVGERDTSRVGKLLQ
jgi:hypothetical protein